MINERLDMRPSSSKMNLGNSSFANPIFCGQIFLFPAIFDSLANFAHLVISQFCLVIGRSFFEKGSCVQVSSNPTLCLAVGHIFRIRANPKMLRINATGVVTSMANEGVSGYFANKMRVSKPVTANNLAAYLHAPISFFIGASEPNPATVFCRRILGRKSSKFTIIHSTISKIHTGYTIHRCTAGGK